MQWAILHVWWWSRSYIWILRNGRGRPWASSTASLPSADLARKPRIQEILLVLILCMCACVCVCVLHRFRMCVHEFVWTRYYYRRKRYLYIKYLTAFYDFLLFFHFTMFINSFCYSLFSNLVWIKCT